MIEALIALLLAVLFIAVLKVPQGILRLGQYGGLAFVLYVAILLVEFIFGRLRS